MLHIGFSISYSSFPNCSEARELVPLASIAASSLAFYYGPFVNDLHGVLKQYRFGITSK